MADLTGSEILGRSLKNEGTKDLFFIMGGPMMLAENSCVKEGIRPIDVRHEQAAALMAQAYSRLLQKPSVCMAASGPGVINLTTGVANALIDCAPVVASRRLERHQAVRQAGVPGNRPARDHEGLHQVGRPRRQSEADTRDGEYGLPEGDGRQARAGLSRFSGRYPLRQDPGGPGRLELERSRAAQPAADGRARACRRADRCALEGEAADHTHRQRRHLVAGVDRAAVVRGEVGHTLLHDAARPRRAARRSPAVFPHHALLGVQRCRPHTHHRHAHELHHRPRRASALCRQRHDCPDRHRRG